MYGSAVEAWKHIHETDMNVALRKADEEEEFIVKHTISVWTEDDSDYPQRLKECPDAPLLLFGKGNMRTNEGKMVSVVGTRTCTDRGRDLTRQFVLDLAHRCPEVTIVS